MNQIMRITCNLCYFAWDLLASVTGGFIFVHGFSVVFRRMTWSDRDTALLSSCVPAEQ